MTTQNLPKVSVCVCTYQRPKLLAELLDSLASQTFSLDKFEVIVVDNDQTASARSVVDEAVSQHPMLRILYDIEPTQGISYARNRTVKIASGELLAFIDDDEVASENWLLALTQTLDTCNADVVLGPVITVYPTGTLAWVKESRFFERQRYETGLHRDSDIGGTGNALIKSIAIKSRRPQPFSEALARSGGEDHDLMKWLEGQGAKLVWCDTAEVHETLPLARQSPSFIFERGLRSSVTYWRNEYTNRQWRWILTESIKGLLGGIGFLLLGCLLLPIGLGKAMRIWVKGLKGIGRVVALTDISLIGYGKKS
jgi:glycosyltransferase involved in cell wall biosynthesis